jgi:LytS/YehU family sensor histidine kinase
LQAQLNPHFIFNALNAIQMYINLMDKRRANEYLVKLARLMRLFLDASREPFGTIQNEVLILSLYCELEKLRFEDKFDYEIHCDDTISRDTVMFPSMLVQPFVENAINHGLMNKGRNALLVISFVKKADQIVCTIDDNGIGRKKAMEMRQKSGRNNRSWGVSLSEERVQALNKLNGNNTSIKIIDKTDSDGNAAGTRVVITVSVHTNRLTNELHSYNH